MKVILFLFLQTKFLTKKLEPGMSCDNTEHLHTLVKSVTFLDWCVFMLDVLIELQHV